jgi:glycosyltransferase involved in cell wall biosynthesis
MVFASRIDHMKGLDIAIEIMRKVESPCTFRVAGSVSDTSYWQRCLQLAEKLPDHVTFEYAGPYRPDMTLEIMSSADFLFLPTRGENFGHAIAEALSVGCPVIISRETIWTDVVNAGGGNAGTPEENLDFIDAAIGSDPHRRLELRREVLRAYSTWYSSHVSHDSFFSQVLT